jgi:hypothetical protein
MAVSRPFVLTVLGVLLAVATFASMRSAAERAQADDTAATPTVQPAPGATTATEPDTTAPAKPETTTTPAKPKAAKKKAAPAVEGVPPKVAKALQKRRTVVLFFRQPAADDDATAAAVRSVRGKGVSVFTAPISKLARYRRVVNDLGITQAPAVVIVGKDRKARLLEGYIDPVSLRQQVKDGR